MSDVIATARSRGALARVQTLRLERRTREAQALISAVGLGQLPGVRFGRVEQETDTAAVILGEHAALERVLLLLRQDDDDRFKEAVEHLDAARQRLLPTDGAAPVLTGGRRRRAIAKLSVVYSQAARETAAHELAAWILGLDTAAMDVWRAWQLDDWRRQVATLPDIRAADHLGNISVRTARVALIEILAVVRR